MRIAVSLLIALHAALHLIGAAKSWNGLLWLSAAGLLFGAAALRTLRNDDWWMLAAAGVVLSQGLIVLHWADAKAGTPVNVVIGVAVIVAAATTRFKGEVYDDVRSLLAGATRADSSVVRPADLERLPQPVRRWLVRSGVIGKPRARTVRLLQHGEIRTSPDGAWMPAQAEQYFSIEPPAFLWSADVTMMRALPLVGRDSYVDGKGHMLIKALSLVDVVDATGAAIDQGTLARFLAECVWFPSAALSPHIAWIPLDGSRAKAIMSYRGVTAAAVFSFDALGRFSSLRAERFMSGRRDAGLTPWRVSVSEWRKLGGVEVPARGSVGWQLATGTFDYYRWEIAALEYDATTPFVPSTVSSGLVSEVVREPGAATVSPPARELLPSSRNDLAPS